MNDLFVGPKRPKYSVKAHRLPMNTMLRPYQLLAKIMLTNFWPIARHIELTVEKAHIMYTIATEVHIDLATHFINVIQKATIKKEMCVPFDGLISRVIIMSKVPLCDIELTIKIYEKISAVTVVKSKTVVSKKRSHPEESTSA
jgi:hypothetical protein